MGRVSFKLGAFTAPNVLRMLRLEISRRILREMTLHRRHFLNDDVRYILSYSGTSYAKKIKILKFDAGTTAIL